MADSALDNLDHLLRSLKAQKIIPDLKGQAYNDVLDIAHRFLQAQMKNSKKLDQNSLKEVIFVLRYLAHIPNEERANYKEFIDTLDPKEAQELVKKFLIHAVKEMDKEGLLSDKQIEKLVEQFVLKMMSTGQLNLSDVKTMFKELEREIKKTLAAAEQALETETPQDTISQEGPPFDISPNQLSFFGLRFVMDFLATLPFKLDLTQGDSMGAQNRISDFIVGQVGGSLGDKIEDYMLTLGGEQAEQLISDLTSQGITLHQSPRLEMNK